MVGYCYTVSIITPSEKIYLGQTGIATMQKNISKSTKAKFYKMVTQN